MYIPGEDMHSRRGCAFPVMHIPIPSEDGSQWNEHPHWECISSLRMVTGNAHPHREWAGMRLARNAYPHWEWECASP